MGTKQSLSFELGLPVTVEMSTDPIMAAELQRILNSVNKLASVVDAYSGNAPLADSVAAQFTASSSCRSQKLDVVYGYAQADIPAGSAVYTRMSGDDRLVYLASAAAANTFATGFCVSDAGVKAGSLCATCLSGGLIPYIGGLSEGVVYFLSSTPGQIISNSPDAGAVITQRLGYAIGATHFYFIPATPA